MIIIRPHPSEDHEPWERLSKKLKKFKIILEGEISPWIYASKQFYIEDVQLQFRPI